MKYTLLLFAALCFLLLAVACQPLPLPATPPSAPSPAPTESQMTTPDVNMPPRDEPRLPEPSPVPLFPEATVEPTDEEVQAQQARVAAAAQAVAARVLDVDAAAVSVRGVKAVVWPDRSLGCLPSTPTGRSTATPGYLVTVQVDGAVYAVHLDEAGRGLICNR